MNLPKDREAAADLTRAQCPECGEHWIIENEIHGERRRMCSRCSYSWRVEGESSR
jgi:ribosomal protein S27AE